MNEDEQEKVYQLIKDQFQNADISCRIVKELLNWHIEVVATVYIQGGRYVITRRTREMFQLNEEETAGAIASVVYVLRHAIGHEIFANPSAPSLEYKEQE